MQDKDPKALGIHCVSGELLKENEISHLDNSVAPEPALGKRIREQQSYRR